MECTIKNYQSLQQSYTFASSPYGSYKWPVEYHNYNTRKRAMTSKLMFYANTTWEHTYEPKQSCETIFYHWANGEWRVSEANPFTRATDWSDWGARLSVATEWPVCIALKVSTFSTFDSLALCGTTNDASLVTVSYTHLFSESG